MVRRLSRNYVISVLGASRVARTPSDPAPLARRQHCSSRPPNTISLPSTYGAIGRRENHQVSSRSRQQLPTMKSNRSRRSRSIFATSFAFRSSASAISCGVAPSLVRRNRLIRSTGDLGSALCAANAWMVRRSLAAEGVRGNTGSVALAWPRNPHCRRIVPRPLLLPAARSAGRDIFHGRVGRTHRCVVGPTFAGTIAEGQARDWAA